MASLPTILLMLAALSVGATVIAILIALRSQREAQSAIFPIVREQESTRAQRARLSIFVWIAITALFLGGWLATLRLQATGPAAAPVASETTPAQVVVQEPEVTREPTLPIIDPSPTTQIEIQPLTSTEPPTIIAPTSTPLASSQSFTLEPSSTFTLTPLPPTATPTNTPVPPTATPTSTATPIPPTPTPTPTPAGGIPITTSVPRTPAPPEARMGPIQFAEDVTPDVQAVNPGDVFPNGIAAVYAIYPFSGMQRGLDFTTVWYRNGVEVAREETEWQYGARATSYSFLVPRGKGLYKLELRVNDTIMASGLFEVR